jgi:hypothetical protein
MAAQLRGSRPSLASDSAALQRSCAPDNCTGVSNVWDLPGAPGPAGNHEKVNTLPVSTELTTRKQAAGVLGKPQSDL